MSELELRTCERCQEAKPISEFPTRNVNGKITLFRICKLCYAKSHEQANFQTKLNKADTRGINFLFPRRCGGCGKRLVWPSRHRGNLCEVCSRTGLNAEQYIHDYDDRIGPNSAWMSCPGCAFIQVCQVRIKASLWTVCEMPDVADLERAKTNGIQTDGRQITLRKDQVSDPLVWPGWWPDTVEIGEGQPLTMERVNKGSLR